MKPSSMKFHRAVFLVSTFAAGLALAPAAARAQGGHGGGFALPPGPSGFGAQGQLVIDGTLEFSIRKPSGGNSTVTIQPAADYFIAPSVSVGAVLGLVIVTGQPGTTAVLLGARAGYNLNINDKISVWPLGGLSFLNVTTGNNAGSDHQTYLNLFAPFLFHPVPHLFAGLGPFVDVGLGNGDTNRFGIKSVVGGWF